MNECCKKPNIKSLNYKQDGEAIENKACLNCRGHWYEGEFFTSKQWDAIVDTWYFDTQKLIATDTQTLNLF